MKKFLFVILLVPFFGLSQKFSVNASKIDPSSEDTVILSIGDTISLLIGESTILKLNFSGPANIKFDSVDFKIYGDNRSLGNNWEIWNQSEIFKSTFENNNGNYIKSYYQFIEIANFDTGKFELPPILAVADLKNFYSNPLFFRIKLVNTDNSDEIKAIKPIKKIKISLLDHLFFFLKNYWLIILLVIIFIVLIVIIIKYKLGRKIKNKEITKTPVSITLLNKINELEEKKYWQNGYYKKYYSELCEILWEFLEDRYKVKTFEQTSDEILSSLKWKDISDDLLKRIKYFFQISDEVKFAKQIPSEKDNNESIKMIKNLIISQRIDVENIKESKNA